MSKTFPQESSEAFLNLKVCITQNKKSTSVFQQSGLKSTSEERHGFIWFLKKGTFWHSPNPFE